jgi:hypothetical protein
MVVHVLDILNYVCATTGDQAVLDAAEPVVRDFITSIPGNACCL